ncbi:MAG: acetate--CoA ligase [Dehalococcoidia bacterium]|nr:acetate--CoA ligase [Dehalococcoidia bacterium]
MDLVNPAVQRWIDEGKADPEAFWANAADEMHWFRKWDKIFERNGPSFKWFLGGQTNIAYNALDYHVNRGWGGHAALITFNERGEEKVLTYTQLLRDVEQAAAALRGMGIKKGDRITVYMPTCAEAITLMLACARIGAIHSVVFAGFGPGALGQRIAASGSRLVFSGDSTYRRGRDVVLKSIVDQALKQVANNVEHVIVLRRGTPDCPMAQGRDLDWKEFLTKAQGHSGAHAIMESNETLYILATSGTTATPKLTIHTHGGYQVGVYSMAKWMFGLKPTDVWWATSEIGWAVGHGYIVYGPLLVGATAVAFEGALDHPGPDVFWKAIDRFGITSVFTSPTAVRLLMRYGEDIVKPFSLKTLERVFCAGEVLNPPVWEWFQKKALGNRVPVIDHFWQTETGAPIIGNPYGLGMLPIKPGSAGIPLPGIQVEVVDQNGELLKPGEPGIMVVKQPFPSLTPALWGEPERYGQDYWNKVPGKYYTGDATRIDEDGYVWFSGRADEVIKIAAHRIGTIEVESAFLKHPAVVEAGVTGKPDELRGEVIAGFIVLKQGQQPSDTLRQELLQTIRNELGAIIVVSDINFVRMLPKTRSGKIMRRVLKAVVMGREPGDITTIEDEGSVEEAREAWKQLKGQV